MDYFMKQKGKKTEKHKMDTQRVDHYLKQHGGATYGPCCETNRTETQQQHVNAADGPFYEAKQKRK